MEASVSVGPQPRTYGGFRRLVRIGTDDQLVALFRMGCDEAFETIHDRYRAALFSYTRQVLGYSNADAEDALQEVFLRAYPALRRDRRPVTLRAWLYRVAHNYCVDQIRRPVVPLCDLHDVSRPPYRDPAVEAEQREAVRRLVTDMGRLPDQQRSALLMQLDGLRCTEIAAALGISVVAVKSGLNRARENLKAAEEARAAACVDIRADLDRALGSKVRMSGRARRHLSGCAGCATYRADLRRADRTLSALVPDAGTLTWFLKLLGIGGAASGATVGTIAVGAPIAAKVTAIACCGALVHGVGGGHGEAARPLKAPTPQHAGTTGHQHPAAGFREHLHAAAGAAAPHRSAPPGPAAPAHPATASASKLLVPTRLRIETHRAASRTPTTYSTTADAARRTGGAAAPDDGPAATADPPVRDERTPNGAAADPDTAAPPDQIAPAASEASPKPQPPADPVAPAPASTAAQGQTAGVTPPPAAAPAAPAMPSESGGGTGASTAAASAPAVP